MSWDKAPAIQFFQNNIAKTILLKEKTTRLRIQAQLEDIVELEMCSNFLFEAIFKTQTKGVVITVTFHDGFIGIQISTTLPDINQPEISFPYQIRYENLILEAH